MSGGLLPEPERRYTLAEAAQVLRERECQNKGHVPKAITNLANEVKAFSCERCAKSWSVR